MSLSKSSNDDISSFHVMTGSSCRVQFFDRPRCGGGTGKALFETKKASLNKFRYTAGANLATTSFDNKISSMRCDCTPDVVYMYQGFVKIPGSDCEGHLPGTNFFSKEVVNMSASEVPLVCRRNCEAFAKDRCAGFKVIRLPGAKESFECSFADAFWFKPEASKAATTETYFAVNSEEKEAPACYIRTLSP